MYSQRGNNDKIGIIDHELEKIHNEHLHYEQELQHLTGVEGIIEDIVALPGVRERFRQIEQTRHALGIKGER